MRVDDWRAVFRVVREDFLEEVILEQIPELGQREKKARQGRLRREIPGRGDHKC